MRFDSKAQRSQRRVQFIVVHEDVVAGRVAQSTRHEICGFFFSELAAALGMRLFDGRQAFRRRSVASQTMRTGVLEELLAKSLMEVFPPLTHSGLQRCRCNVFRFSLLALLYKKLLEGVRARGRRTVGVPRNIPHGLSKFDG